MEKKVKSRVEHDRPPSKTLQQPTELQGTMARQGHREQHGICSSYAQCPHHIRKKPMVELNEKKTVFGRTLC